ncbi:MAG: Sec-independent protein translocase, TatC subunit [Frankiales bacterium]|nr:Sec-independent protein translocase, TatC subunit [Frankiales bacterium]
MARPSRAARQADRTQAPADGRMSLVEHLYELRARLGKSLLAITVCVVVVFVFWEPVYDLLKQPFCDTNPDQGCKLVAIGIFEQFKVRLRVAFLGGIVVASPVWLYQLGAFITPALHRKERRYAAGFLVASLTLFAVGASFAYLTIDRGLEFLLSVGGEGITTLVTVQDYLSFVTLCILAFGFAFEFPVVVMFLHVVGVLSSERMRGARRGTVVAIFAVAAVITPSQDPFTFCFMAVPLCLMYEGCILAARLRERAKRRSQGDPEHERLDDDTPSRLDLSAD